MVNNNTADIIRIGFMPGRRVCCARRNLSACGPIGKATGFNKYIRGSDAVGSESCVGGIAMSAPTLSVGFDPLAPAQRENPFDLLAAARRDEPVFYVPALKLWVVT